jgi:hypothetical protein
MEIVVALFVLCNTFLFYPFFFFSNQQPIATTQFCRALHLEQEVLKVIVHVTVQSGRF